MIYGTAGATPDELFGDRANMKVGGARLFAGCIVAVKADTGEYAWHYQTNIHTENFHVLVTDLAIGGAKRHVVMTVPRTGIFYLLDARSGGLISQAGPRHARTRALCQSLRCSGRAAGTTGGR